MIINDVKKIRNELDTLLKTKNMTPPARDKLLQEIYDLCNEVITDLLAVEREISSVYRSL